MHLRENGDNYQSLNVLGLCLEQILFSNLVQNGTHSSGPLSGLIDREIYNILGQTYSLCHKQYAPMIS